MLAGQVSLALPPTFIFLHPFGPAGNDAIQGKSMGWPRAMELSNSLPLSVSSRGSVPARYRWLWLRAVAILDRFIDQATGRGFSCGVDAAQRQQAGCGHTDPLFHGIPLHQNAIMPGAAGTPIGIQRRAHRLATVRSTLCHFSRPNRPMRKVWKSAPSSHCRGTPDGGLQAHVPGTSCRSGCRDRWCSSTTTPGALKPSAATLGKPR